MFNENGRVLAIRGYVESFVGRDVYGYWESDFSKKEKPFFKGFRNGLVSMDGLMELLEVNSVIRDAYKGVQGLAQRQFLDGRDLKLWEGPDGYVGISEYAEKLPEIIEKPFVYGLVQGFDAGASVVAGEMYKEVHNALLSELECFKDRLSN